MYMRSSSYPMPAKPLKNPGTAIHSDTSGTVRIPSTARLRTMSARISRWSLNCGSPLLSNKRSKRAILEKVPQHKVSLAGSGRLIDESIAQPICRCKLLREALSSMARYASPRPCLESIMPSTANKT